MKKLHAVVCGVALSMTSFSDVMTDCYWHWMNGNISKDGITADLEYMKAGGIEAAMIFDVASARSVSCFTPSCTNPRTTRR